MKKIRKLFTLMEMIITLAVFLILISIVLTFYDNIFKASSASNSQSMVFGNAKIALDIITRDIQCIYYRNGKIPFWHKNFNDVDAEFSNELLAFISTTPLPNSENDSSPLFEVKYQLYYDPELNDVGTDAAPGWILRSTTGDNTDSWNFYNNFSMGDSSSNAFSMSTASSSPWERLTPYATELTFNCFDKSGVEYTDEADSTKFPYSIQVNLKLMDRSSWNQLISLASGRDIYSASNTDIWIFRKKHERTFTQTIFVGEHGQ